MPHLLPVKIIPQSAAFAHRVGQRAPSHSLAPAGNSGWKADTPGAQADELDIGRCVRFLGFVPAADVVQLDKQTALFVYPSKYEGFGLPLLAAMSGGVPVVTANRSATAEVAGDAAALVGRYSVADLAQGMHRALTDRALQGRLTSAGRTRAPEHSRARMLEGICEFVFSTPAANPVNRGAWR